MTDRVRHIVDCAFAGRRIVIFSGGAAATDEALLGEVRAIQGSSGFGSIIGRNSFQRPRDGALRLVGAVMEIYSAAGL